MVFDAADGSWKVEQIVSPGRHQFKFVVDGLWVHDENQVIDDQVLFCASLDLRLLHIFGVRS